MEHIGIVEIEAKVIKLTDFKAKIEQLLGARSNDGFSIFRDLRRKDEVAR